MRRRAADPCDAPRRRVAETAGKRADTGPACCSRRIGGAGPDGGWWGVSVSRPSAAKARGELVNCGIRRRHFRRGLAQRRRGRRLRRGEIFSFFWAAGHSAWPTIRHEASATTRKTSSVQAQMPVSRQIFGRSILRLALSGSEIFSPFQSRRKATIFCHGHLGTAIILNVGSCGCWVSLDFVDI